MSIDDIRALANDLVVIEDDGARRERIAAFGGPPAALIAADVMAAFHGSFSIDQAEVRFLDPAARTALETAVFVDVGEDPDGASGFGGGDQGTSWVWAFTGTHDGPFNGVPPTNQPVAILGSTIGPSNPEEFADAALLRVFDSGQVLVQLGAEPAYRISR